MNDALLVFFFENGLSLAVTPFRLSGGNDHDNRWCDEFVHLKQGSLLSLPICFKYCSISGVVIHWPPIQSIRYLIQEVGLSKVSTKDPGWLENKNILLKISIRF